MKAAWWVVLIFAVTASVTSVGVVVGFLFARQERLGALLVIGVAVWILARIDEAFRSRVQR